MNESNLKKIDKKKLPWFYKLILKIPGTGFLESSGGIFWAVIVPLFLISESFLTIFLIVFFPFPINVILTAIIPITVLLISIRISLERFINWWNSTFGESCFEWNVERAVQEYIALVRKKTEKKE